MRSPPRSHRHLQAEMYVCTMSDLSELPGQVACKHTLANNGLRLWAMSSPKVEFDKPECMTTDMTCKHW